MSLPTYNDDVTVICGLLQINEGLLYRMVLGMGPLLQEDLEDMLWMRKFKMMEKISIRYWEL